MRSERNGARGLEFEGFAKAIEGLGNGQDLRDGVGRREPLVLTIEEKRMVEAAINSSGKKKGSLKLKILKLVLFKFKFCF